MAFGHDPIPSPAKDPKQDLAETERRIKELDGRSVSKEEARELALAEIKSGALRRSLGLPDRIAEERAREAEERKNEKRAA
jgi:hypothetical protein